MITGTFLDEITHNIPSQNWGRAEWDRDFAAMKAAGIRNVVLIRCGYRRWITYPSRVLAERQGAWWPSTDLVALFLVPRTGPAQHADVGVVAPTGPAGRRLADTLPFFATGVVYPDWCVLSSALPAEGRAGARAAGFYDAEGRVGADSALR